MLWCTTMDPQLTHLKNESILFHFKSHCGTLLPSCNSICQRVGYPSQDSIILDISYYSRTPIYRDVQVSREAIFLGSFVILPVNYGSSKSGSDCIDS
eukprot:sb/3479051/